MLLFIICFGIIGEQEITSSKARANVTYKLLMDNINGETIKLQEFSEGFQGNQSIKSAESEYKVDKHRFSPYNKGKSIYKNKKIPECSQNAKHNDRLIVVVW